MSLTTTSRAWSVVSVIGQSVVWYEYVCTISVSDKSVISDTDRMSKRLEIRHQTSDSM